jgi:hypothetical protein
MDPNPSLAKRRISSNPSHGFFSRFRRSTRWAFVSLMEFVIKKQKPTAKNAPGGGLISADYLITY